MTPNPIATSESGVESREDMGARAKYTASYPKHPERFTADQLDLVRRRTQPLLKNGTHLSIEHLLQEAYLQGLRDASEIMQ